MTPARGALLTAQQLLVGRLAALKARIDAGENCWLEYAQSAAALAVVAAQTTPEAGGQALTTAELAERLKLTPRTIRRYKKSGKLTPILNGGAVRWSART